MNKYSVYVFCTYIILFPSHLSSSGQQDNQPAHLRHLPFSGQHYQSVPMAHNSAQPHQYAGTYTLPSYMGVNPQHTMPLQAGHHQFPGSANNQWLLPTPFIPSAQPAPFTQLTSPPFSPDPSTHTHMQAQQLTASLAAMTLAHQQPPVLSSNESAAAPSLSDASPQIPPSARPASDKSLPASSASCSAASSNAKTEPSSASSLPSAEQQSAAAKPPYSYSWYQTAGVGKILKFATKCGTEQHSGYLELERVNAYDPETYSWPNDDRNNLSLSEGAKSFYSRHEFAGLKMLLAKQREKSIPVKSTKDTRTALKEMRAANDARMQALAALAVQQYEIAQCIDATRCITQDETPSDDETSAEKFDTIEKQLRRLKISNSITTDVKKDN